MTESPKTTRALGMCLGASNMKAVEIIRTGGVVSIGKILIRSHESNPRTTFVGMLKELDAAGYDCVALTGRKFRDMVALPSITEPEAVEYALGYLRSTGEIGSDVAAVASLGAENFVVYLLDNEGNVASVETGNKCASGTGEFFLQQIGRMNIGVDEAVSVARGVEEYKVSGRCSVFCKSDCTHALNKGIPIGRVASGLGRMMAEKVLDLLEKVDRKNIVAVGGVTRNLVVMDHLVKNLDTLTIPKSAEVFEALGAALYALDKGVKPAIDEKHIFVEGTSSFVFLPPISKGASLVEFKQSTRATAQPGDECILGLDVGSTTTKAVVMRRTDDAVLASIYLRTNGNPVKASRECYAELHNQLSGGVKIVGLATTGSGRQIAGLHAQTDAIINEIIAHATGASHFDKDVDTIFEIGGQDAKYTYLTNAVPSDYAMNEACSAGTGSFLEESARESLGVGFREIEAIAQQGQNPPNFNDQCAAFISSDIKTATHEGIGREDVVAGLVYSICMNYVNRVKGQRRSGRKIFMQGGVCYNKAVPLAMAKLIGRPIVVPPEPGLIGAYGVALELKNRITHGLASASSFDLKELADREIEYGKSFRCAGGAEKCDRGCEINMMTIGDRKFPFGGACNKYYNQVHHIGYDITKFDYVRVRQEMLFTKFASGTAPTSAKTVGISRSYLTNNLYPLYHGFFTTLGLRVVLSDDVDRAGIKRKRSAFCYPGEIAHGCFANLLKKDLDYIFMPTVTELFVENSVSYKKEHQCTCMLLQSEAYWIRSAFKDGFGRTELLTPLLNFSQGYDSQEEEFRSIARSVGCGADRGVAAYHAVLAQQQAFMAETKKLGLQILAELEADPSKTAVVLFGRTYNAFAGEANMGIPTKLASRGVLVIPWDFLPFDNEPCDDNMCWANGQMILRASSFVKKHPQLFGTFITNFSCGPDSFLLGYFRDIMKAKPSLTLELDSHTADAGVNTRIEAFLDIVTRYRELGKKDEVVAPFTPAKIEFHKGTACFVTSDGETIDLHHPKLHVLFPSMGRLNSEAFAAAVRGGGIRATCIDEYDFEVLKVGRANSSCKECLPLQLTVGGLLDYLAKRSDPDEYLVYFMPTASGNCRFTQYSVFTRSLLEKNRIRNVALLSLTNENSYAGMPTGLLLNALRGAMVADAMDDIRNALRVLAVDREAAFVEFERQWKRLVEAIGSQGGKRLYAVLAEVAEALRTIPVRYPIAQAKAVSLLGEIFVRRDHFACQDIVERLARRDIIVRRAPMFEWLKYIDHMVLEGVYDASFGFKAALEFYVKLFLQDGYEKRIKRTLDRSGLYINEKVDIPQLLAYGRNFFDLRFTGESILVVGSFFKDILHTVHGVISIGPFACMPTRVIEAVLAAESTIGVKKRLDKRLGKKSHPDLGMPDHASLPFLSIESDGNPFPQIVEARVEAFCLQVDRVHRRMSEHAHA